MPTPIMGAPTGDAETIAAYILARNPAPKIACTVPELVEYFIAEGRIEGVRGDVAIFQAGHETGWFAFGGDVKPEQNNYCGLGATGGGVPGLSFPSPRLGVRAQIQHLKAYASKDPLVLTLVDPRFRYVTRGIAPNWEDLSGRWAVPGIGYGERIVAAFEANGHAPDPLLALRADVHALADQHAADMAALRTELDALRQRFRDAALVMGA